MIALREPMLRPDGGNTNWEYIQTMLKRHLQNPEVRVAVATFFETLSRRKDAEYRLNSVQFEKFTQLMGFIIQVLEENEDYTNLSRLVYFTQYFCTIRQTNQQGQEIGDFSAVWMATKYLEMDFMKKPKYWEQSTCWVLHEAMFEQRNQEPWRLFVNIYYRNLPIMCKVIPDAEKRAECLKQVLVRCDLDETPELMKKLADIAKLPLEGIEVNFAIKKAFVGLELTIGRVNRRQSEQFCKRIL